MSAGTSEERAGRPAGGESGAPGLLEAGDHACLAHGDPGERVEVGVPFLRTGLDAGERVLCVLGSSARRELREALGSAGVDTEAAVASGALTWLDPEDYPPAGPFEPTAMLERLEKRVVRARNEGFGGARLLVDMRWILDADVTRSQVLDYERMANDTFFSETQSSALCLYPRDAFGTEMLDGAIGAHPLTVLGGEAAPNPLYHLGDRISAGEGPGTLERLDWIEPRLRRAAEAERAFRELDEVGRRRDEFLAMLAHELRNPLAGISNAGGLLEERAKSDPSLRRVADVIDRQVGYLSVMLDDLLDLVRITRDEVELDRQEVRLEEIVAGARKTVEPWAESRGVELEVELSDDTAILSVDRSRLERALVKLAGNGVSYSEEGDRVRISASVEGEDVVISVRDEGAGIAPDLLPRIFEPFVRGEEPQRTDRPGLGVGLAIVKHSVELHGGRVEARSDGLGEGAELTIRIPVGLPGGRGDESTRAQAPSGGKSTDGPRILVVDDDRDSVGLLRDLLEAWGLEADVAYDGEEAVEAAERASPEIVFLDLGLPGLDGLEVARRIRERSGWGDDEPILIAMTGYGRPQDMERTREAGFQHHLVKPVSVDTVRELLDRYG